MAQFRNGYRSTVAVISEAKIQMHSVDSGFRQIAFPDRVHPQCIAFPHIDHTGIDQLAQHFLRKGIHLITVSSVIGVQILLDGFVGRSKDSIIAVYTQQTAYRGLGTV